MKKFGITLISISILIILSAFGYKYYFSQPNDPSISAEQQDSQMVWGATIRPYAVNNYTTKFQDSWVEDQFQFMNDLYPEGSCIRANIESDLTVNDLMIEYKDKYNNQLYFILEDHTVDFNKDLDFKILARNYVNKIVPRYRGDVEYYQLSNEITGQVFYKPEDTGPKLDAGYGLYMDKTRYDNIKEYLFEMAKTVRAADPDAKLVISGHWVLTKPITDLLDSGLDIDIVGWNWGSGISDNPGIKDVDNYGTMNLPELFTSRGKEFWIVEANYDDGSMNGKEQEQADYIQMIAEKAKDNPKITGYFHFFLTDANEEGPIGHLGLINIKEKDNGSLDFGSKKPAFYSLQRVAN